MIGFIDTLHTTGTIGNYSITSNFLNLQFTITHKLGFSVFTSRILATDFITGSITVSLNHTLHITRYYSTQSRSR
jgi:hypothetical protein